MSESAFIISVLRAGNLEDITKTASYFGVTKMQAQLQHIDEPAIHKIAERKLNNVIQSGMNGVQALFESKAMVIMDRVKSRDLFDLMVLMNDHHYTIDDIAFVLKKYDDRTESEIESALEVLTGNIGLDKDDPGFNSIHLDITMEEVYAQLTQYVNEYEQKQALRFS